jgi:hypothetical protein
VRAHLRGAAADLGSAADDLRSLRRTDPAAPGRGTVHPEGRWLVRYRLPLGGAEERDGGREERVLDLIFLLDLVDDEFHDDEPVDDQFDDDRLVELELIGLERRRGREAGFDAVQLTAAPGPIPSRRRALPSRTNTSTCPELSIRAPRAPWGRSA